MCSPHVTLPIAQLIHYSNRIIGRSVVLSNCFYNAAHPILYWIAYKVQKTYDLIVCKDKNQCSELNSTH